MWSFSDLVGGLGAKCGQLFELQISFMLLLHAAFDLHALSAFAYIESGPAVLQRPCPTWRVVILSG
jgi:hypothetical protein